MPAAYTPGAAEARFATGARIAVGTILAWRPISSATKDDEKRRHTALQVLARWSAWLRFVPYLAPISSLSPMRAT